MQSPESNLKYVIGDLISNVVLPSEIDAVVHTAARSPWLGVSNSAIVRDNVILTDQLIRYAIKAKAARFIYLSSISVYGDISNHTVLESTPIVNPSIYGAAKRLCEQLLETEAEALNSISIRLPGVIGPMSVRNWLSKVINAAKNGEEIIAYNPDVLFNNAAHVNDIGSFVLGLLSSEWNGFEVVNTAAQGEITIKKTINIIVDGIGSRSKIVFQEKGRNSFTVSSKKAIELFGYKPMLIENMLKQFVKDNIIK